MAKGVSVKRNREHVRKIIQAKRAGKVRKHITEKSRRVWRWEVILEKIPYDRPFVGAEIGVLKGATARRVLSERPKCTHIMVDPWLSPQEGDRYADAPGETKNKSQEQFDECYRAVCDLANKYKGRANVIRATSAQAAPTIKDDSLDYVFIDAEHTYEALKEDIALWLPKVKDGGWIGGHDYGNLPKFPGVQQAVDEAFPSGVEVREDHTWFVTVGGNK